MTSSAVTAVERGAIRVAPTLGGATVRAALPYIQPLIVGKYISDELGITDYVEAKAAQAWDKITHGGKKRPREGASAEQKATYDSITGTQGEFGGPKPGIRSLYGIGPSGGICRPEMKYYDTYILNVTVPKATTLATITCLNHLIAQGTQMNQRIGRKIMVRSIQVKYIIFAAYDGAETACVENLCVRLVLDRQCNGVLCTEGDIYNLNAGVSYGPIPQTRKAENLSRFDILREDYINANAWSTVFGNSTQPVTYYIPCNIPILYDNTSGMTSVKSNNLCFMMQASGLSTSKVWKIAASIRLRYTDA